jgi:membrane-bound lytic murein transglycosylase D
MSLTQFLQSYFGFNLLLVLSFLLFKAASRILDIRGLKPSSQEWLSWQYRALAGLFLLSLLQPFFPKADFFEPPVKQWVATSSRATIEGHLPSAVIGISSKVQMDSNLFSNFGWGLGIAIFLAAGLWMLRDAYRLARLKHRSYAIRKVGNVEILVHERVSIPFSFWWFGHQSVLLPFSLLARPSELRIAILHELQHHRQGDTRWVYLMWVLRWLCFWNPFVYFWNRWICENQEFACDEALVDQKKVSSLAYARCLVEVAETAILQKDHPVCAAGMMFRSDSQLLKRRIEMMCSTQKPNKGRSIGAVLAVGLTSLMVFTAYASSGWIQDRRISMSQAQLMTEKARSETGFPIALNELVLTELNRYLGTIEGREFIRLSLQRMETYRPMVETKIQQYAVPAELMAVPITESGYRNLPQPPNSKNKSAGLWQFIPSTARIYGLRVDEQLDQRLNPEMETDAAFRYLKSNALRFQDWQLAVLAYNMGEQSVQKAIEAIGSRNAWTLIRAGYEGDARYLAKINAAMIILKNPDSVK